MTKVRSSWKAYGIGAAVYAAISAALFILGKWPIAAWIFAAATVYMIVLTISLRRSLGS